MKETPSVWAIVPAAGKGTRMGAALPKQYLPLAGKTVIEHTLERLLKLREIEKLVVVLSPSDQCWQDLPVANHSRIEVASGGKERHESVLSGLYALDGIADKLDWVLVHDAARACIVPDSIRELMNNVGDHLIGGILGVPVSDTLKQINSQFGIETTVDRRLVWYAQTPQYFRYGVLREALESAVGEERSITDEASALEAKGYCPRMVEGRSDNIKITRNDDLWMAEMIMRSQLAAGDIN